MGDAYLDQIKSEYEAKKQRNVLAELAKIETKKKKEAKINTEKKFQLEIQKSKDISFFLPAKYEKILLPIYLFALPYLLGHLFIFGYISKFNFSIYLAVCGLDEDSHSMAWFMGYEGASLAFSFMFISMAFIKVLNSQKEQRERDLNPKKKRRH